MNLPNASGALGHVRRRWPWRWDRRVGFALLALLVAAEIGIAAYLIARSSGVEAPDGAAIERRAFQTTFDLERAQAAADARQSGRREGQQAGRLAGERAGARIGERRGLAAVKRKQEAIARQEAILAAEAAAAAAAAEAATRQRSRQRDEVVPPTPAPTSTPPVPTPAPQPSPPAPDPPCFDAAGYPC